MSSNAGEARCAILQVCLTPSLWRALYYYTKAVKSPELGDGKITQQERQKTESLIPPVTPHRFQHKS